jgi:CheY-like chemotaxis protein
LRDHRTGPQAIEAVRARLGRAVPAIIVTGDTAADRLRTAVGSGMTLLHKPVGSVLLQRALAQALTSAAEPASDQADAPSA